MKRLGACPRRVASQSSPVRRAGSGRRSPTGSPADGYDVVYADVDVEGAQAAAAATGSLAVELDVRDLDSVEACLAAAADAYGGVDVWVNNAAVTIARSFFEIEPAEWDDVIATNLRGVVLRLPRRRSAHARPRHTAGSSTWRRSPGSGARA